ncbi:bifunctional diguanylate cyclase/phosphodiesterase, partial [[Clostridium] symbiosum]|nr:bifunctional diguanylate cyclase/phosphodiesterase [[Clostridium] symbiosum]
RERFNGLADRLASFGPFEEKNYQVELISGVYIPENPSGMDIDEMLNRANMARKSIVSPRGSRILFFTEELRKKALAGIEIEAEMRSALEKEEFVL